MTNLEVINFVKAKNSLKQSGARVPIKFGYALNKNFQQVKAEFETLVEVDPFIKFQKDREEIQITRNKIVNSKDAEEIEKLTDEFQEKNEKYIEEFTPENEKWEELLKEEIEDKKFSKVKIEDFPETITDAEMEALMFMIEE